MGGTCLGEDAAVIAASLDRLTNRALAKATRVKFCLSGIPPGLPMPSANGCQENFGPASARIALGRTILSDQGRDRLAQPGVLVIIVLQLLAPCASCPLRLSARGI